MDANSDAPAAAASSPSICWSSAPTSSSRWTTTGARSPAAGWPAPAGSSTAVGGPARHPATGDADPAGRRLPGHAGPGQHAPSHLPEPHPVLSPGHEQHAVRLAHHAVPPVGPARRRGVVRLRLGRAWPSWRWGAAPRRPTTSTSTRRTAATCCRPRSRPPATSACGSTRPGGRCRCRRRTGACRRLGRPGRRRDPRGQRGGGRPPPRPEPGGHGPRRAGARARRSRSPPT